MQSERSVSHVSESMERTWKESMERTCTSDTHSADLNRRDERFQSQPERPVVSARLKAEGKAAVSAHRLEIRLYAADLDTFPRQDEACCVGHHQK